jgi:chitin disaccharide deacetylase
MKNSTTNRRLIVNADDFGLSPGVNRGIAAAHEHGIVTSASLMVRWPAAEEAAAYAHEHTKLSVGLHFDLGEWTFANETWRLAYEVVPADKEDAVQDELARQLDAFRRLLRRDPTHLDSHQHVHRSEPVRTIVLRAARNMGIVVRSLDPAVRYCGQFYGQSDKGYPYPEGISVSGLLKTLHELPAGITEMGCHPGESDGLNSIYCHERATECRTLCDPRVRAALAAEGILLCSFSDPAVMVTP